METKPVARLHSLEDFVGRVAAHAAAYRLEFMNASGLGKKLHLIVCDWVRLLPQLNRQRNVEIGATRGTLEERWKQFVDARKMFESARFKNTSRSYRSWGCSTQLFFSESDYCQQITGP